MSLTRKIDYIVVHCADSTNGEPLSVKEVDKWHLQRKFHREIEWRNRFNFPLLAFGYQYLIDVDGKRYTGRHLDEVPAAVEGYNHNSVNICLAGKDKFTQEEWDGVTDLVKYLQTLYPQAKVVGHYQFDTAKKQGKTCPNFDVPAWVKSEFKVPEGKLFEKVEKPKGANQK